MVDYLDSLPLAAAAGHGEVHGLGDGPRIWYGVDFAEANRLLATEPGTVANAQRARVFRRALSLILAARRPRSRSRFPNRDIHIHNAECEQLDLLVVLFNRFFQPDLDLETLSVKRETTLSTPSDIYLPLTWIALRSRRLKLSRAAGTGVDSHASATLTLSCGNSRSGPPS